MHNSLNEIATASSSLKEYIRQYGDTANPQVVKAQIDKMSFHLEVLQGVRKEDGSLVGA